MPQASFQMESMGMFNELAAISAPEGLWLNAVGLICLVAFALAPIGGVGGGTRLTRYRFIFTPQWSRYRVGTMIVA